MIWCVAVEYWDVRNEDSGLGFYLCFFYFYFIFNLFFFILFLESEVRVRVTTCHNVTHISHI